MADLQALFQIVDQLPPEDFAKLYQHVVERRRYAWGIVPPENLAQLAEVLRPLDEDAARMTEDEINTLIDEELTEVRRERKAKSQSRD